MLGRAGDIPDKVRKAGAVKWYKALDDRSRVKLNRYAENADASSAISFFTSVMDLALKDENYPFASFVGGSALKECTTDIQRFIVTERMIEAYMGSEMYDSAKEECMRNLDLYPKIRGELYPNGIPEKLCCRGCLIDVLVGIESNYDEAQRMLLLFRDIGMISDGDLNLRSDSLRIHRLQRAFDGVYTYRRKE